MKTQSDSSQDSSIPKSLDRLSVLIGDKAIGMLKSKTVVVVGLGGVGSWAAEGLARSGVGNIYVIDGDKVDETNINRQLFSTFATVGMYKARAAVERLKTTSNSANIIGIEAFLTGENMSVLSELKPDCVIDAIDHFDDKIELLKYCVENSIPVVSSMGAGGKTNPYKVTSADISKTHGCMLAKKLRRKLKDVGISKGIRAVFNPQDPIKPSLDETEDMMVIGSAVWITGIFGFALAYEAVSLFTDGDA